MDPVETGRGYLGIHVAHLANRCRSAFLFRCWYMSTLEDEGTTLRNVGNRLSSDAMSYPGRTCSTIPLWNMKISQSENCLTSTAKRSWIPSSSSRGNSSVVIMRHEENGYNHMLKWAMWLHFRSWIQALCILYVINNHSVYVLQRSYWMIAHNKATWLATMATEGRPNRPWISG
jgi:hypothetical protein